jgi:hypothetical protein
MQVQRLITAGKELIKGDFDTALKSLSPYIEYPLVPQSYRPSIASNDNWFFEANGKNIFHFKYSGHNSSVRAYECCPPVNAIINRKAQAYINGKTWVLNLDGKKAGKVATTVEEKK